MQLCLLVHMHASNSAQEGKLDSMQHLNTRDHHQFILFPTPLLPLLYHNAEIASFLQ